MNLRKPSLISYWHVIARVDSQVADSLHLEAISITPIVGSRAVKLRQKTSVYYAAGIID